MKNRFRQSKLSSTQLNRIVNRFVSKREHPKAFLQHPYKSQHSIIATNAHTVVFIRLEQIEDHSSIANSHIEQSEAETLEQLEWQYSSNHREVESIKLDYKQLETIIKTLKQHQKNLKSTTTAITSLTYNPKHNELTFITSSPKQLNEVKEEFHCRPYITNSMTGYSMMFDTSYLINALMTQKETGEYTKLEALPYGLRLSNDTATVVIMMLKL